VYLWLGGCVGLWVGPRVGDGVRLHKHQARRPLLARQAADTHGHYSHLKVGDGVGASVGAEVVGEGVVGA
jgi:hypothetical protein